MPFPFFLSGKESLSYFDEKPSWHPKPFYLNIKEMATASVTASNVLQSTTEKENYLRIARLVIVGGTNLMREVFDFFYPPSDLPTKLTDPATKNQLRKTLIKPQLDQLYPSPGVYGESKDFDISLLSKLITTICPLTPPLTGWNDLPNSTDLSLSADIVRIKVYRNEISHKYHKMEIGNDEFPTFWNEIKEALIRIARYISTAAEEWEKAIDELLNDPLTPEAELNAKELQEWYLKDMDLKECTEQGLRSLKRQIKGLQVSFGVESQRLREEIKRLERELHDAKDQRQRIRGGNERLEKEIQNKFQQIRDVITRRASSSREPGGKSLKKTYLLNLTTF